MNTPEWIEYTGSDDQISDIQTSEHGWMTLDEFLKSGFIGWYWIYMQTKKVYAAYFDGYSFLYNESIDFGIVKRTIDQVMPIHKPELPR